MGLWYTFGNMLSHGCLLNMVVGMRGGGKSVSAQKWCIKGFIENKEEFVWIRRFDSEIKEIRDDFLKDMHDLNFFEGHELVMKKNKVYIDGEVAGHLVSLTKAVKFKSKPHPRVKRFVFDEFITDQIGNAGYKKDEVNIFLGLLDSLIRLKSDARVLMIGNNLSVTNPYFIEFGVNPSKLNKDKIYVDRKIGIAIEYYMSSEFKDHRLSTPFGRLISNTRYGEMSLDNKAIGDDPNFIKNKTKNSKPLYNIEYKGKVYGLWIDYDVSEMYVSSKHVDRCRPTYTLSSSDHTERKMFIQSMKSSPQFKRLRDAYSIGALMFDDNTTKYMMYEVLSII